MRKRKNVLFDTLSKNTLSKLNIKLAIYGYLELYIYWIVIIYQMKSKKEQRKLVFYLLNSSMIINCLHINVPFSPEVQHNLWIKRHRPSHKVYPPDDNGKDV